MTTATAAVVPTKVEARQLPDGTWWIVLIGSERLEAAGGGQFAIPLRTDLVGEDEDGYRQIAEEVAEQLDIFTRGLAHITWPADEGNDV